ncbi:uncharacterized protein LOC110269681 [Arachis ipaensis]|uniref:uncharacterized protein LOC110269681 n=1 Tax=Arachis ipaensis TaxID=130454 RepID=UPI000A2B60DC|nr:uncharacterized protein LOC110269681 [Arachis ipaensis]
MKIGLCSRRSSTSIFKWRLFPTTINKVSPIYMPPIFRVDNIRKWNWGGHVLEFIIKGISKHHLKKKKSIDGCLYALMIVYFHESKQKNKNADAILGPPWVRHWTKELLLQRIKDETHGHMGIVKRTELKKKLKTMKKEEKKEKKRKTKKKEDISSESNIAISSESKSEQDSEESTKTRKQPTRIAKK